MPPALGTVRDVDRVEVGAVRRVHPPGVHGQGPGDVPGLVAALPGRDVQGVHLEAGDEQGAVGDHGGAPDVVGHPEPPGAPAGGAGRGRGDPADPVRLGGRRARTGLFGARAGAYPDRGPGQPDLRLVLAGRAAVAAGGGDLLGGGLGVRAGRRAVHRTGGRRRVPDHLPGARVVLAGPRPHRRGGVRRRPVADLVLLLVRRHLLRRDGRRPHGLGLRRGRRAAALLLDQGERVGRQPVPGLAGGVVPGEQVRGQLDLDLLRGRPVLGGRPHTGPHQVDQLGRQAGEVGLLAQQLEHRLHRVGAPVGRVAGGTEDQQRAEREDITGAGDAAAVPGLLRRHVRRGADRDIGHGEPGAGDPGGDTEVDHPGAVLDHQDVGRLEVAVDQSGGVDGLQRLGDAGDQPAHRPDRQRPAVVDQVLQGGRRHVRGGQPGHPGVRVRVDHGRGVETADRLGGRDLPCEPDPEQLVLGQLPPHGLDRHPAAGRGPRQVDQAHSPRPEPPQHLEGPDPPRIVRRQLVHPLPPPRIEHRPRGAEHPTAWCRTRFSNAARPISNLPRQSAVRPPGGATARSAAPERPDPDVRSGPGLRPTRPEPP